MDRFDDVVTGPPVRRATLEEFVADPTRVGELLHGRYSVYTTSGTTGRPGVFLHDPSASAVYQALVARVLEPVTADHARVPPGELADTVLAQPRQPDAAADPLRLRRPGACPAGPVPVRQPPDLDRGGHR